jgi:hypothetical protein
LAPFEDVGVQCVHEDDFAKLAGLCYRWWWLDPLSEETAVEGVQIVGCRRHVCWAEEHLPGFDGGALPVFFRAREDTVCGLGFADVGLIVEKGRILTVEDLQQSADVKSANSSWTYIDG